MRKKKHPSIAWKERASQELYNRVPLKYKSYVDRMGMFLNLNHDDTKAQMFFGEEDGKRYFIIMGWIEPLSTSRLKGIEGIINESSTANLLGVSEISSVKRDGKELIELKQYFTKSADTEKRVEAVWSNILHPLLKLLDSK